MVESALTLPLVVFLLLGALQLFLMMQGRVMAEYAAFRATRVGSTNHGQCGRMLHAALLTVLPTIESFMVPGPGTPGQKLAAAFRRRASNQYNDVYSDGGRANAYGGAILWLGRARPLLAEIPPEQDRDFDQPEASAPLTLETRLVFWFPLRVPFANWVMSTMMLAHFGLRAYTAQNPLMLPETARWVGSGARLEAAIADELRARHDTREYVFPISASAAMRMMSPAKRSNFATQNCPPAPAVLR